MTDESSIRKSLNDACAQRGIQAEIAKSFDVHPSTVKRWLEGGDIPSPMLKLLDLYFFGTIPFEIAHEKSLHGVLDFTPDQWRVIEILARRESTTSGKWISNKIRAYLAFDEAAKAESVRISAGSKNTLHSLPEPLQKVAEEPPSYGTNGGNG